MDGLVSTLRQQGLVDDGLGLVRESPSHSPGLTPIAASNASTANRLRPVSACGLRSGHDSRSLLQQKRDAVKRSQILAEELEQCQTDFSELGDHAFELQAHEEALLRKLRVAEEHEEASKEMQGELRAALLEQTEDMRHMSSTLEATHDLQRGMALENADLQMQVSECQWRSESAVEENERLGAGILEMQKLQREAVEENLNLCQKLTETQRAHQEALVCAERAREEQEAYASTWEGLEREVKELRRKVSESLRTKQVALEENKSLRARLRDMEATASQLATAQETMQRAKSEKQALRDQISHHVETARQSAQRLRDLEASNDRLEMENRQLKRTLAEQRRALEETQTDNLHADLASAHRTRQALIDELSNVREGMTVALVECQQLRGQLADKEGVVRELLDQREMEVEELVDLRDSQRQHEFESTHLRTELDMVKKEIARRFEAKSRLRAALRVVGALAAPHGHPHSWLLIKTLFEVWRSADFRSHEEDNSKLRSLQMESDTWKGEVERLSLQEALTGHNRGNVRSEPASPTKDANANLDAPLLFGALNADRMRREELLTGLSSILAAVRPQLEDLPGAAESLDRTVYSGLQFLGCCDFHDRGRPVPFRYELCRLLGRCSCPGPSVLRPYKQIAVCAA